MQGQYPSGKQLGESVQRVSYTAILPESQIYLMRQAAVDTLMNLFSKKRSLFTWRGDAAR